MANLKQSKTKRNTTQSSKWGGLTKRLNFRSTKTRFIVTLLVFGIVGGGLMVYRSFAATGYTWSAGQIMILKANAAAVPDSFLVGQRIKKQDGRAAIQSVATPNKDAIGTRQELRVGVNSSVTNDDTYCFAGKNYNPNVSWNIQTFFLARNYPTSQTSGDLPVGDFLVCARIPGRPASQFPGESRTIVFHAVEKWRPYNNKAFFVFNAGRRGY